MNVLANFVHSKINDKGNGSETGLSNIEREAWKDLQTFLNRSPQEVAAEVMAYVRPAEWPAVSHLDISSS